MITIKRLKELIADLPDDVAAVAYEGESIGLTLSLGNNYGFIHTGYDTETPADEEQHDTLQLVKGSEKFQILPAGAEFTSQQLEQSSRATLVLELLAGIDRCEVESDDGWWETTEGAKFGAAKLAKLMKLIADEKL